MHPAFLAAALAALPARAAGASNPDASPPPEQDTSPAPRPETAPYPSASSTQTAPSPPSSAPAAQPPYAPAPHVATPEEAASYSPPKSVDVVPDRVVSERQDFHDAVEGYLRAQEEGSGVFRMPDDLLKRTWRLRLRRVRSERKAGPDVYEACADFSEIGGKSRLDLDVSARRIKRGSWKIETVKIHSVDGRPRAGTPPETLTAPPAPAVR